jgi:3-isopropylmalate/(R)-2-methylmalate dehydratase small subunit
VRARRGAEAPADESNMESIIQGRVYKFGDNLNSDIIIPGRYLIYIDRERLGQHAFEMLGEGFPGKLRNFDILVAGRNFGCGSAREQAATAIQGLGIKAVVACSFARTFYRNAINDGLPIVECPSLHSAVTEGDEIRIDLAKGMIEHQNFQHSFPCIPESVRRILELGGLAEYLRTQLR